MRPSAKYVPSLPAIIAASQATRTESASRLHGGSFLGGDVTRQAGVNVVRLKVAGVELVTCFSGRITRWFEMSCRLKFA
jgi:hypothetical protein